MHERKTPSSCKVYSNQIYHPLNSPLFAIFLVNESSTIFTGPQFTFFFPSHLSLFFWMISDGKQRSYSTPSYTIYLIFKYSHFHHCCGSLYTLRQHTGSHHLKIPQPRSLNIQKALYSSNPLPCWLSQSPSPMYPWSLTELRPLVSLSFSYVNLFLYILGILRFSHFLYKSFIPGIYSPLLCCCSNHQSSSHLISSCNPELYCWY